MDFPSFLLLLWVSEDSAGLEAPISAWTPAASPRLSFLDGENYSQMRGKEGNVWSWRDDGDLGKDGTWRQIRRHGDGRRAERIETDCRRVILGGVLRYISLNIEIMEMPTLHRTLTVPSCL